MSRIEVPKQFLGSIRLVNLFEMGMQDGVKGRALGGQWSVFDRPRSKEGADAYRAGYNAGSKWRREHRTETRSVARPVRVASTTRRG